MALEDNPENSGWRIGMAHDIFISYSTKDKTIADAVCAKLEEGGIRAWIAPRDVPAGTNFAESIIDAINSCQVFVLIWSADTNTSQHILNEVNQAFNQGITIIPFRIQDVQPTSAMRYYIGRTHWLDAIDPPLENHISTLRNAILANLGREINPSGPVERAIQPPADPIRPPADIPREKKPASLRPAERKPRRAGTSRVSYPRYIPFVVGGLALVTLIGWLISGGFKGSPGPGLTADLAFETENISETEIFGSSDPLATPDSLFPTETPLGPETVEPSDTAEPTAASTAVPAWVTEARAWAEPILAAVNDLPPDFADDFSQVDTAWLYSDNDPGSESGCDNPDNLQQSITDGVMKLSLVNCQFASLSHPELEYANYILQLEVYFQQNPSPLGLEIWNTSPSSLDGEGNRGFFLKVNGGLWGTFLDDSIAGDRGFINLDFSQPITITIIHQSPSFLVLLNSIPLTYNVSNQNYPGPFKIDFTVNSGSSIPVEPYTLELDNIKIWDLDRIQ